MSENNVKSVGKALEILFGLMEESGFTNPALKESGDVIEYDIKDETDFALEKKFLKIQEKFNELNIGIAGTPAKCNGLKIMYFRDRMIWISEDEGYRESHWTVIDRKSLSRQISPQSKFHFYDGRIALFNPKKKNGKLTVEIHYKIRAKSDKGLLVSGIEDVDYSDKTHNERQYVENFSSIFSTDAKQRFRGVNSVKRAVDIILDYIRKNGFPNSRISRYGNLFFLNEINETIDIENFIECLNYVFGVANPVKIAGNLILDTKISENGKKYNYGNKIHLYRHAVPITIPKSLENDILEINSEELQSISSQSEIRYFNGHFHFEYNKEYSAIEISFNIHEKMGTMKICDIIDTSKIINGSYTHDFPENNFSIALIMPETYGTNELDVFKDLNSIGHLVNYECKEFPVNMNPGNEKEQDAYAIEIANAIREASEKHNIIVLTRGGVLGPTGIRGETLFDDRNVCEALAASKTYRIVAIGHSEHIPGIYAYADYKVDHPSGAGKILKELILSKLVKNLFNDLLIENIPVEAFSSASGKAVLLSEVQNIKTEMFQIQKFL